MSFRSRGYGECSTEIFVIFDQLRGRAALGRCSWGNVSREAAPQSFGESRIFFSGMTVRDRETATHRLLLRAKGLVVPCQILGIVLRGTRLLS